MRRVNGGIAKGFVIAALAAAALAGCAEKAPVAVVLPTPTIPQVVIPPRPYPPLGAPPNMTIPAVGVDGVRMTVNTNLTADQTLWNLRSAYNVAALNCRDPEYAALIPNYGAFLKTHSRALSKTNRDLDAQFRREHGAGYIRPRETYMTQVYNYFANPVTLDAFCDTALEVSRSLQLVEPGNLATASPVELAKFEQVFESFFRAYEQYRIDAANWDALYSPRAVTAEQQGPAAATPSISAYSPAAVQQ